MAKATANTEEKLLEKLDRIEDLLEKLILFQARSAGVGRTALAKWMRIDFHRIAAVSKVIKSAGKEKK
jgi:hypothetical protein